MRGCELWASGLPWGRLPHREGRGGEAWLCSPFHEVEVRGGQAGSLLKGMGRSREVKGVQT